MSSSGEDVLTKTARDEMARKVRAELTTRHRLSAPGATYAFGYARWRLDLRPEPPARRFPTAQADLLEKWVNAELGLEGIDRPTTKSHYYAGVSGVCEYPKCGRAREHPIHAPRK